MKVKTMVCSNCGGNPEFTEGMNKVFCLHCGTQYLVINLTTLPECYPETGNNINLNIHEPESYTESEKEFEPVMKDGFRTLEELLDKPHITGVTSGYEEIDRLTAGFHPGELIIIAARPGMGKTALALNIAQLVTVKEKLSVAVFSLEMSKEHFIRRLICSHTMIDFHKIRTGSPEADDRTKLAQAMEELSEANIYIDDTPGISIAEMKAKLHRLKMRKDIKLIIIDYLQLISSNKNVPRNEQIIEILKGLKNLARELSIPVIALSQVGLTVDSRTDKRPRLSDLREFGPIDQYADTVIFIYRDDYYNPEADRSGIAEIITGKQSHGPIGTVELLYLKEYSRFVSRDKYDEGIKGNIKNMEN